jgi:hypothetical protein
MKSSRQVSQGQERPALTTGSMQGRSALCLAEAAEQQAIRAMAAQPGKMSLEEYVAGASLHFMPMHCSWQSCTEPKSQQLLHCISQCEEHRNALQLATRTVVRSTYAWSACQAAGYWLPWPASDRHMCIADMRAKIADAYGDRVQKYDGYVSAFDVRCR